MTSRIGNIIRDFGDDMAEASDRVSKRSFINVMQDASIPVSQGGRMPVATGNLRDSVCVRTSASAVSGVENIASGANSAPARSFVEGSWEADYADDVEFGANGVPARAFARVALAKWEGFVATNAAME